MQGERRQAGKGEKGTRDGCREKERKREAECGHLSVLVTDIEK